jgi:hypothetical protein
MARIVNLNRLGKRFIMISVRRFHFPIRNAFDYLDAITERCEIIDYKEYKLSEIREIVKRRESGG